MIDTGITIKLYSFSELNEKAKRRAIEEHREFELNIIELNDFENGIAEYDYYAENDEPIIEIIEANDYLFFANGELANTVRYCGNHPLAGEIHFIYNGTDYLIKKEKTT